MMKKTLLMMLALLLTVTAIMSLTARPAGDSRAEQLPEEDELIEGILLQVNEDSVLLMDTDGRQVQAMLADITAGDVSALQPGDYVRVRYNGLMSRSIPAIVGAKEITCGRVSGTVTEVNDDGLVLTDDAGLAHLVTTEEPYAQGTRLTVYAQDVSGDISQPLYIRGPEITGTVTGVT